MAGSQIHGIECTVYAPNALLTVPSTAMLASPASPCFAGMGQFFPIGWIPMALKHPHRVLFSSCASQFVLKV
jgi:hypothetical protein